MSLIRRVARPMLAAMFVVGGLDQLRHPGKQAQKVAPLADRAAPVLGLPNDPELLVRANGAAMVGGGVLFAMGVVPRVTSMVLAGTLVPTTYAGHPFWEAKDPATRAQQRTAFLKNLGILGGLLLATVDTEGRPGLAYRVHLAGARAERAAKTSRREARHAANLTRREAKHAARAARREAKLAATQAHDALT
ncbi:MAG TPA: DoxX family protein [Pedococcus sp.]|jgi:uncharacterized membrane protein YphA (DoxX/SURF4 family)